MLVVNGLGQMREAGKLYNMYSRHSIRPFPYKSENQLIAEGEAEQLIPPWGNMDWPKFRPAPPVPSLEHERMEIKRGMRRRLWPHAGTWNLNADPLNKISAAAYQKDLNPLEGLMLPNQKTQIFGAATGTALVLSSLLFKNDFSKKLLRNVGYVVLGITLLDYAGDKLRGADTSLPR